MAARNVPLRRFPLLTLTVRRSIRSPLWKKLTSTRWPGAYGLTVPITGTLLMIRALPPWR